MSLHLGNLSSRTRRDELERVFRRFGRCNVQLKDGFGFVIYELPTNADRALRALRGKSICGEPITLSWSNRQPRPFHRFSRGNRSNDMQRGRNPVRREDYVNRKLDPKSQQDYQIGLKHADNGGGRPKSADMVDDATSYHQENIKEHIGEKHDDFREDLPNEGDNDQTHLMDNDRWGERVGVPANEIGVEGGLEFDRYEPYHDDERRDEGGKHQVTHSGSSPTSRKFQDKIAREQMDEGALNRLDVPRSHQTCYICGELGHKMHSCPQKTASRRKKFSRFDRRHGDDINFRYNGESDMKKLRSNSQGGLHLSSDAVLTRRHKGEGKVSRSRKHKRLVRGENSQAMEETHGGTWRKDYLEKKRSRREDGTPERHAKKARVPVSSSIHSDYTASRSLSHSESSKFVSKSGSHSKSRSVSSRSRSPSSRSRSGPTSSSSYKSMARSRSRSSSPTSLSLSVSLGRPLASSPNKIQMNQKGSLVDAMCLDSKEVLMEPVELVEGDARSDNSKLENMALLEENNSAIVPFEVEQDTEKDHPPGGDGIKKILVSKVPSEMENSSTPLLGKGDATVKSLSPLALERIKGQTLAPTKRPDSEALTRDHLSAPMKKPDSQFFARSCTANPTSISSEELHMVMQHYDLDCPVGNERDLPIEAYFGTARLWPWQIIYYRRLRKGPISTENYARRIAQNQEFGVVDKYIRSSSGWGELGHENV